MTERLTVQRVCPFCEATCGVELELQDARIVKVRGDRDDPFSRGFICPKAHGLKELHEDPERLRQPLKRTAHGWQTLSWEEAYAEAAAGFAQIRERHGNDAIGMYLGNPIIHDPAFLYLPVLAHALASRSIFNASAIDTLPKEIQTGLMFGGPFPVTVPIPDIDRSDFLLIVGANPMISHGSVMTMPNAPGRLRDVLRRGGRLVVIDPRRSETARMASEHHFIRPGTDAAFLLAVVHTLVDEDLVSLGAAAGLVDGLAEIAAVARGFTPEVVAERCGIGAATIRRLARELAGAPSAACYGRLGTCVQPFGTLACWGIELINILSGNLDRPGGVMFPAPAAPLAALARAAPFTFGRWRSRVSGQPEVGGMIPSSTMAEEMLTPGPGQVRAMLLLMTNPLRSAANSGRLTQAFAQLDFIVALDFYLNETTRHAHLILPTPSPAEQANYELLLYHAAVRNVTKWSPAALAPAAGQPASWEVMLRLAGGLLGQPGQPSAALDEMVLRQVVAGAVATSKVTPPFDVEDILAQLPDTPGPARLIDLLLRLGPYGDGFGRRAGLTLAAVQARPHGLDLGALQPRLPEVLNTRNGRIDLAPATMLEDVARLHRHLREPACSMLLIGRRQLRAANSFMHNLPSATRPEDGCTLHVAPADARRLGLLDGADARITSRTGSVVAPVVISDDLMPGVVSLPHGWGHAEDGTQLTVASRQPGVNANALTDDSAYDAASGTAVLFGTPVTVQALTPRPAGERATTVARSRIES